MGKNATGSEKQYPENKERTMKIMVLSLQMAGSTGLEPAASGVTGRRYNHLNYDPKTKNKRCNRDELPSTASVVGETGIEPVTSSL